MVMRRIRRELGLGLGPLVAVAALTGWIQGGVLLQVVGIALVLYGVQGAFLLRYAPSTLPGRDGMGPANRLTLLRSTLVFPLAALLPVWPDLGTATLWWVIALASVALVLDGVDGKVARKTGSDTAFGARFDMELDAFLILVLATGVWLTGPVGAWVLLVGLLRYLFVAAGWAWPRLQAPLPESRRRKVICVVQGVALLVALGPILPGWLAVTAGAVALGSLLYSFGVDTLWLVRRRDVDGSPATGGTPGPGPFT
jgi:phosphatidylglycerophosphate synthase